MLNLESGEYLGATKRKYHAEGILISETEYHQRVFEGWHFHKNRHLTFIVSGGNKEQRKRGEVESFPGAVVIYNRGELHRNRNTLHPSRNVNVEIEDSFFSAYALDPALFEKLVPENPALKISVLKAYHECLADHAEAVLAIHSIFLNLLARQAAHSCGERPLWVRKIRDVIHDRWNEKLSLQQLAHAAGVHPVTVSRNFPRHFSCSLGEYLRRVKIEKSLHLIKQTDNTLTEIAFQCGFADQSHFIRAFKATTGFLPKEFRKL